MRPFNLGRAFSSANRAFLDRVKGELDLIRSSGLWKEEKILVSPQSNSVKVLETGQKVQVINFCSNNYLGLSNHPDVVQAGIAALKRRGAGMGSVRFICGTQDIHKSLERKISGLLGKEDTILYSSCFEANCGFFEVVLGPEDAVISDALNHASLIDGIRLCRANRFVYAHNDMKDLDRLLREATGKCRNVVVVTDGVFSMDGELAKLPEICELCTKYGAILVVDDSHATGILGFNGGGTPEHFGLTEKVDVITSTLGKALGGASGGFISSSRPIIDLLRQRSRPYLFSNTLAPAIVAMSSKAIDISLKKTSLRKKLIENTILFRERMAENGFKLMGDEIHPIAPVLIGNARMATSMAADLLEQGIYVVSFSYPVVPKGQARIRVQISAAHTKNNVEKAALAFKKLANKYSLI